MLQNVLDSFHIELVHQLSQMCGQIALFNPQCLQ